MGWDSERELLDEVTRRLQQGGYVHVKEDALAEKDWWGVIAFAAPHRYWDCFDRLEPLMSDAEYAATVREIWTATDGLPPADARRRLLDHGRSISRAMWMTPEDQEAYRRLPEMVTVYRGCVAGREDGWCWTLSRDAAEHFAHWPHEIEARRLLLTGSVPKDRIIALFTGNWDEAEVIVPGESVSITSIEEL